MIELLLMQMSAISDFSYEIRRAKETASTYGNLIYRDERVHVRKGANGSQIETFCAITQYRSNETGHIVQDMFYWVVKISPAEGYLSDYERGSWAGVGNADTEEYKKLCIDSQIVDDFILLSSKRHRSSGSIYDPRIQKPFDISSKWLVGSWVYNDNCATNRDELFSSDGYYDGTEGYGKWHFDGSKIRLEITSDKEVSDPAVDTIGRLLPKPKYVTFSIEWLGYDLAKIDGYQALRC